VASAREEYTRLRDLALGGSVQDKINYVLFLAELSSKQPMEIGQEDWREAWEIQREFSGMPPEEFVREYDRLARGILLGCGNPLAFASVTNLLLPALYQAGPETLQPLPFDSGLYRHAYSMFIENSEKFLTYLDSVASTPEERGMVSRARGNLNLLKGYGHVLSNPTGAQIQIIHYYMEKFAGELEHDLGSLLRNYRR